jgi:hypothetical protein
MLSSSSPASSCTGRFGGDRDRQDAGLRLPLDLLGNRDGAGAKPLFPVKWEEGFERPLAEWREELNIHPVTDGVFSWYTRPNLAAAVA